MVVIALCRLCRICILYFPFCFTNSLQVPYAMQLNSKTAQTVFLQSLSWFEESYFDKYDSTRVNCTSTPTIKKNKKTKGLDAKHINNWLLRLWLCLLNIFFLDRVFVNYVVCTITGIHGHISKEASTFCCTKRFLHNSTNVSYSDLVSLPYDNRCKYLFKI